MYFAVTHAMKIGNKTYLPCICYEVTEQLKKTVEKLVQNGKATTFKEYTFFANGRPLKPVKADIKHETPVKTETVQKKTPQKSKEDN